MILADYFCKLFILQDTREPLNMANLIVVPSGPSIHYDSTL